MKIIATRKENLFDIIKKGIKKLFKRDLIANKIHAIGLMLLGYCSTGLLNGDSTVFILTLFIGVPLFFSKENYIN